MKKAYAALWLAFVCLVWINPCSATRGGLTTSTSSNLPSYDFPCPQLSQNWCTNAAGWTVYTASAKTNAGTACGNSSSTTNETCIVAVDSVSGNNTTCAAQSAPSSGYTTEMLSTFSPSLPCQTPDKAQLLLRANSSDWVALKKGSVWTGGINGTASASWSTSGASAAAPMVVWAYGTGVRPQFVLPTSSDIACVSITATRGQFMTFGGFDCYKPAIDPSSPSFLGASIVADTGVANCGSATVICNINGGAGLPTNITGTNFAIAGNGINILSPSVSITAGATSITMNGSASFTATQMPIQIVTRFSSPGFSLNNEVNFLTIEDVRMDFTGISIVEDNVVTPPAVQIRIRRNMINQPWSVGAGNQQGIFIGPTCPNVAQYPGCAGISQLIEGNVINYGGWNPSIWAAGSTGLIHDVYVHDPATPRSLRYNTIAHNPSDNQFRDGSLSYDNLFLYNSGNLTVSTIDNPISLSYDVTENGSDIILGVRSATVAASSGTSVSIDGAISAFVGQPIIDVSNPGAIPNTATVSSISGPTTVAISTAIQAGIRGNGVQIGDTIRVFAIRGGGTSIARDGLYVNAGPATGSSYAGPSTVSVSAASPAIVAETGAASARSQDEPFQFTFGTLPTGASLSTTYCADPANGTNIAYPFYLATSGACTGGADINTSGSSGTSIARTGSRLFKFATASEPLYPWLGIPTWVTATTSVYVDSFSSTTPFPGTNGGTTVGSISSDRFTLITADPSNTSIIGGEQRTFVFGLPSTTNLPSVRFGPNNLFVRAATDGIGTTGAMQFQTLTANIDASLNYIYNWDPRNAADNIQGTSFFSGTNNLTQVLNSGFTGTPDQSHPNANVEAYDASLNGSGFNGTISGAATFNPGVGSSYDGGVLVVNSGTPPSIGDTIFCASCAQYITVASVNTGGGFWVKAPSGTLTNVGPIAMTNGSADHYLSLAINNSKDTWNATYTSGAVNNFTRNNMGCTVASTPSCPAQPYN